MYVIPLLQDGDWFPVTDLKDAYFHISIHPDYRRYSSFTLDNVTYQFKSIPFGLSTAPMVFTKCLTPVAAYLYLQGITIFLYLDDWLLVAPSWAKASKDTDFMLSLLRDL